MNDKNISRTDWLHILTKGAPYLFASIFIGAALAGCSVFGSSNPDLERKIKIEERALDERERNIQIQMQNAKEQMELQKVRAKRACQRNNPGWFSGC